MINTDRHKIGAEQINTYCLKILKNKIKHSACHYCYK